MKSITFKDVIADLLGNPSCIGCGKTLDISYRLPLCSSCLEKWHEELDAPCINCGNSHNECICRPYVDKCIKDYVYLVPYKKGMGEAMILELKELNSSRITNYLSLSLAEAIKARFPKFRNIPIVVNVPRSRAGINENGFDQAEIIAKKTAEYLGLKYVNALSHPGNRIQKTLNLEERVKNAGEAYKLNEKYSPAVFRKNIILIDDVVTSGSSTSACATLLKSAGASDVYVASVARSELHIAKYANGH